jgi:hypothetical protein
MDYWALLAGLAAAEAWALRTRWARWGRAEVSHQFDHHIGIGNIRQVESTLSYIHLNRASLVSAQLTALAPRNATG